jgi:dGTPase
MATQAGQLAAYAAGLGPARGRVHPEPPAPPGGEYQCDRERIIHSAAFRRLEYKTQVFVNHEGDLFRTRLTHTIEVAQIGRRLARVLGLNEDLVEAIALAHDLGHTPFGHAGQDALDACMQEYGGFEHNLQSLRVVDELEERFATFDGLNLTFDTREGILKHCAKSAAERLGEVARRFLSGGQPSLEAQLTNLADEIAYTVHDVDDGLRSGLIEVSQLLELELFRHHWERVAGEHPGLSRRRTVHVVVQQLIDDLVHDLCAETGKHLARAAPASLEAVREMPRPLVAFGASRGRQLRDLKGFLHRELYRHYRVRRMSAKARRVIVDLFTAFIEEPQLLPTEATGRLADLERTQGRSGRARCVADYVAGMTDRYAIAEHGRLFHPGSLS